MPYTTTLSAASAACDAIIAMRSRARTVCSLQEWHALAREAAAEPRVTTARDPAFVAPLRGRVRGEVREAEPLARYSTYRIGGPATVLLPAGRRGRRLRRCRLAAGDGRAVVRARPRLQRPAPR